MSTQNPIIEVRDLVKVYGGDIRALDGITFTIAPGELFGFLGPNGAGKTTTIRILATLLRQTAGTARVAGFDVASRPQEVRKRLGRWGSSSHVAPLAALLRHPAGDSPSAKAGRSSR